MLFILVWISCIAVCSTHTGNPRLVTMFLGKTVTGPNLKIYIFGPKLGNHSSFSQNMSECNCRWRVEFRGNFKGIQV
jgi:hypothetical protein